MPKKPDSPEPSPRTSRRVKARSGEPSRSKKTPSRSGARTERPAVPVPFSAYLEVVREHFGFLTARGYPDPRSSGSERECTVVYWGNGRANVAIYNDGGSEPFVQLVPLWLTRADRSTRTFGLHEAIALIAPELERQQPKPPGWPVSAEAEQEWIAFSARALALHFETLTLPAPELLDRIERRREERASTAVPTRPKSNETR